MNQAQLINQNSSDVEYFSPLPIVNLARTVMGSIDLDPASSAIANVGVGAKRFYSIDNDGMFEPWFGNVWMNWPFGRREPPCQKECDKNHVHHDYMLYGNAVWSKKLMDEWLAGNIDQACVITYACTSEAWFKPLMDFPQCFLSPRTNYYLPDGTIKKGVTKGSVVTYFGNKVNRFTQKFSQLGTVKILAA